MEEDLKLLKEDISATTEHIFLKLSTEAKGAKLELKKWLKWRRPPIEEDLKILKVEYLSNHWTDLPQIFNLSLGDQSHNKRLLEMKMTSNGNISATTDQIVLKF